MQDIRRLGSGRTYGALLPLNEAHPLFALSLQQGPVLDDGDSRGAFSQPPFRRALDFYAGLFRDGLAPRMSDAQVSNVWDEFARGLFAFYITGPWNIGEFRRRLPAERQGDWAAAPLPGPDGPGVSTAGGSSLVIFKSSRRKEAAWKLISFLSEPETMQRFHALTGDLPPRRSAWKLPALASDPPSQAFARATGASAGRSQDPRVGTHLSGDAAHRRTGRAWPTGRGGRLPAARRLGRCSPREAPLVAAKAGMTRRGAAAWILAGPALLVIAVFFAIPVAPAWRSASPTSTSTPWPTCRPCASSACGTTRGCCRRRSSGKPWATRFYFVVVGVPASIGALPPRRLAARLALRALAGPSSARRCSRPWSRRSSPLR